jgi:Domain of unknown function (DUF4936)
VSGGATQVFVYYRVRAVDAAASIAAVQALHARLATALPGLVCGLSQRAGCDADPVTLMETYSHVDGVSADMQRDIEAGLGPALQPWLVGERHVEVFVPCA